MKRIGFLGGTFNPVHIGHLAIAQMAKEAQGLDKVIFVPSNWPPHKHSSILIASSHRYRMVKLAIGRNPAFGLSDYEIKKKGPSYTIDTLRHFRKKYPRETKMFFIIGGDLLSQLKEWKFIHEILKIAQFIAVNRPSQKTRKTGVPYISVAMPGIDISSSYLRARIRRRRTVKYFVADQVIGYIEKHKLYQKREGE